MAPEILRDVLFSTKWLLASECLFKYSHKVRILFVSLIFLLSNVVFGADQKKESSPIPADIDVCEKDTDCIIVHHRHCCGTTKKAINSKYLKAYNMTPSWQKTEGGICAVIGQCLPNDSVTKAHCVNMGNEKHCIDGPRSEK